LIHRFRGPEHCYTLFYDTPEVKVFAVYGVVQTASLVPRELAPYPSFTLTNGCIVGLDVSLRVEPAATDPERTGFDAVRPIEIDIINWVSVGILVVVRRSPLHGNRRV